MNKVVISRFCWMLCAFSSLFLSNGIKAGNPNGISIIPQPSSISVTSGSFVLEPSVSIYTTSKDEDLQSTIKWFRDKVAAATGIVLKQAKGSKSIGIQITGPSNALGEEGYKLEVLPAKINISASASSGVFYALQTLLQLLPPDIESPSLQQNIPWVIPCVEITDSPRFKYRGMMLDVSRHFFTKEEVKRYIDEMARYKFNILHWHLNDDEGWRIEIKGLPKLTSVGAWRVKRTGHWGTFIPRLQGEEPTYGGYYTQDDVKEIIAYAKKKFVTIIPEIDVPGHGLSLIASYPDLSCTQLPYGVNEGRKFYTRDDNALCIGNDTVFSVLNTIFSEVAQLFPSEYIHVGGDEAYKGFWRKCPKCQRRIKEEGLKDEDGLQSYFIKRVSTLLASKGKRLIGWDEILQGGIAPNAIVMSYRGMDGGIEAAKMKHEVIMTPASRTYLNFYQGETIVEPPAGEAMCRMRDSYTYDPVPVGVDPEFVLGGQGCLWSEHIPTYRHLQYLMWPRGMALSEVYWSKPGNKDWKHFINKVEHHFLRLNAAGIKYSTSMYNVIFHTHRLNDYDFSIELATEIEGLDIYYTFDETNPDPYAQKFTGEPIVFPIGATHLKVITYRNGKPIGAQINMPKETLLKRL
ncbi:beta-N-acetylhexosaminidase [Niabella aurantiaca]|uniref:beta-N-acetylhexosaminidase n=1 Tax=Niabella aurantiaca TaxID=379900 RepID=UPI0003A25EA9|nr:family 20 glycosylhydrolase [Niabella aurantiaca]